jgi:RsiW-degrading membrane proteinase PrsW (M82 family)
MVHAVLVLVVSTVPALAFLVLILALDRREPEPLALVLAVMGLGGVSAVVAALVEFALQRVPLFGHAGLLGAAAVSFLQIAPVEEAAKLAVVMLFAWRKPAFNEENDGIVYLGAAAIGFALLENVIYVVQFGLATGAARAVSAVPLHVFTGVLAGLHVGLARFASSRALRIRLVLRGFALAWFVHGLYDTLATSGSALALLVLPLVAGLAAFGIVALRRGRRLSLARWGPGPSAADEAAGAEAAAESAAGLPAAGPRPDRTHRWMPAVARTLLAASALFWLLLIAGLWFSEAEAEPGAAVLGGLMLTIIPVSVGVLLEAAWQKRRKRAQPTA